MRRASRLHGALENTGPPVEAGSSHTVEKALQEIATVVLSSAIVARVRVEMADGLKLPARWLRK